MLGSERAHALGAKLSGANPKNFLFSFVAGAVIAAPRAMVPGEGMGWIAYIELAKLAMPAALG